HFWPGPLTLVLKARKDSPVHPLVTAGLDTVAIRAPRGIAAEISARIGRPLAAPSANPSGKLSPTSAHAVATSLGGEIALIIDGGPTQIGVESTIVRVDGERVRILRPGGVTADEIEAVTGIALLRAPEGGAI